MQNSELEPKSLFHMVQFLMYCMSKENDDNNVQEDYTITSENTL